VTRAAPDRQEIAVQLSALVADVVAALAAPPDVVANTPTPRLLLTVEEAAARLGIGRTTTWSLVRSGDLDSVRIGRLRRVHVDAIAAYAARLSAKQHAA